MVTAKHASRPVLDRDGADDARGETRGQWSALEGLAELAAETFGRASHVVWCQAERSRHEEPGGELRLRFDPPHAMSEPGRPRDGGVLAAPMHTLVARVRGLVSARRALREDSWIIVAVPNNEALIRELRPMAETETRLVVLPVNEVPSDAAALRSWLTRVRFENRGGVRIPLGEAGTTTSNPSLDDALVEFGLAESRFVLIRERGGITFPQFAKTFPDRVFEVDACDETTLSWCAGLLHGGCRLGLALKTESVEQFDVTPLSGTSDSENAVVFLPGDDVDDSVGTTWRGNARDVRAYFERGETVRFVSVPTCEATVVPRTSLTSQDDVADFCGFTAEELQSERTAVLSTSLGDDIEAWHRIYASVGQRKRHLWRWCARGAALTTLPGVDERLREDVRDTKVLSIILCVLLDDVADEVRDPALLESLIAVVEEPSDVTVDDPVLRATSRLSRIYHDRIRSYPRYEEYRELLQFDQCQYSNTMRYSCLLNRQGVIANETEHDLYLPHNMHMMSFATLDLMCDSPVDADEVGTLREAVWEAQCMARIGNVLATRQREFDNQDYTNAFFAHAVSAGRLRPSEMPAADMESLARQDESYFVKKWLDCRDRFIERVRRVKSVDGDLLLTKHERFFRMHLGSRGLI